MRVSKKSRYGLRAMIYLAKVFKKGRPFPLKKIAQKEAIPFDYLEKIFSKLEKAGLVHAKKGVNGGYFLSLPPWKIKVGDILRILEGTMAPVGCVAKEKDKRFFCPRKKTCKSFFVWKKVRDSLTSALSSITLADLIRKKHAKEK